MVEAVQWFRKAAEQENAYAQGNLAYCYAEGQGVEKDVANAEKLYRKSAGGVAVKLALIAHGRKVSAVVGLYCLLVFVYILFHIEHPANRILDRMKSEKSSWARRIYWAEPILCLIVVMLAFGVVVWMWIGDVFFWMETANVGWISPLAVNYRILLMTLIGVCLLWGCGLSYEGVRLFVKRRRERDSSERPTLSYAQYARIKWIEMGCQLMLGLLGIAIILLLVDYSLPAGFALFFALMVGLSYSIPTNRKYAKIMGEDESV